MSKSAFIAVLFSYMQVAGFAQGKATDNKKPAPNADYSRAVRLAASKPDSALYYYAQYRITTSAKDSLVLKKEISFYNNVGSLYLARYMTDSTLYRPDLKKGLTLLKNVIDIDSTDLQANFNLMLVYYNNGVWNIIHGDYCKQRELIKNTDWQQPDSEIPSLVKLLECIKPEEYEKYHITDPFRAALPFALRVYRKDPSNKTVLEALQGIYIALGDEKQSEFYKAKFEKAQRKK